MKFIFSRASKFFEDKKTVNLRPDTVARLYQLLEIKPAQDGSHHLIINLDKRTIRVYDEYIE